MKRVLSLALFFTLLLSLTACGSTPAQPSPCADSPRTAASAAALPEPMSTPEPTPAFEELIAVDNELCFISVTGLEPDGIMGYSLKVYLENRSSDKTYVYLVSDAAVNGVQADASLYATVAPGKKANDTVSIYGADISETNIGAYTDIELTFRVYDADDWGADDAAAPTVHIYPLGEGAAASYVRQPQPDDITLVDNDSAAVIVTGFGSGSLGGYSVELYLVNKTDTELMFSVDAASINGFMADPFWASSVGAGRVGFSTLSWSGSKLAENNISDVEQIELLMKIYDWGNWSGSYVFDEYVQINTSE